MRLPAIAGVYAIIHIASGRRYVGSARDMRARWWQHQNRLRGNRHDCHHLQRAWNKYGSDAFRVESVEACLDEPTILVAREQFWLDHFKGILFNHREVAEQFSAEWYRTPEGKAYARMHAERIAKIRASRPVAVMTCEHCGEKYERKEWGKRSRYCTNRCACAARASRPKNIVIRDCVVCGFRFETPASRPAKCCSKPCSSKMGQTAKLTDADVAKIREMLDAGYSGVYLSKLFRISTAQISRIRTGTRWAIQFNDSGQS
jgi:group I intron endonuclease